MPTAHAAHTGTVAPRDGFALSDVATFVAMVVMIVIARRALRRRKHKD